MLFDTHFHLLSKDLYQEWESIVSRASDAGVKGLNIITAEVSDFAKVEKLRGEIETQFPHLVLAHSGGLHPHDTKDFNRETEEMILQLSQKANVIGETGLDYFYENSPKNSQQESFQFHIDLAKKSKKALVVHCREAASDIYEQLKSSRIQDLENPGVIHCFAETKDWARKFLDLGMKLSFTGIITFKRAEELRKAVEYVPLDRMMIETDSPYLAPIPHRGKRNEPSYLPQIFDCLCSCRMEEHSTIMKQLWQNSLEFLGIENSSL